MAKFFIDRPVFAWVIALFVLLAGILAIPKLPISQYPQIAPPTIIHLHCSRVSTRFVTSLMSASNVEATFLISS